MNIDINTFLLIITSFISGASIILHVIAPLTKTKKDDKAVIIIDKILKFIAFNKKEINKLDINVKR